MKLYKVKDLQGAEWLEDWEPQTEQAIIEHFKGIIARGESDFTKVPQVFDLKAIEKMWEIKFYEVGGAK